MFTFLLKRKIFIYFLDPNTLPEGKISWVEVAAQLNDERIPLDYNRRWRNIIRMNQKFNYPFETDIKVASKVLIKSSKNEVEDIEVSWIY